MKKSPHLIILKNLKIALAQWIDCQPVNQRVTSSIPSQGTGLGCRYGPHLGAGERPPIMDLSHIDVSLFLLLLPSL